MAVASGQVWFSQDTRAYTMALACTMATCAALVRIEKLGVTRLRLAALIAGEPKGFQNLFLRQGEDPSYRLIVRPVLKLEHLRMANGAFELKEHLAWERVVRRMQRRELTP